VSPDVLTRRQLNRATLQRQLLLDRSTLEPKAAVNHLVGLQAQIPHNPYTALWSRLADFDPAALSNLIGQRELVRIAVMRSTIHLVTDDDCLVLRPLVQPVLDRELANHREHAPHLVGVEIEAVMKAGREILAAGPLNGAELRRALEEQFPGSDGAALAYACRNHLALVQVPPRGLWRRSGEVRTTTAEAWLGRPIATEPSIDDVVLRYLAAFGPASNADIAAWSRLTGIGEVTERLRPKLRSFRDERGRELHDLPDAPRPDPDTPAPPRFLPEYDNAVLSHDDRTRIISEAARARLTSARVPAKGSLLVDGEGRATWRIETNGATATLVVDLVDPLDSLTADSVVAEGRRLLDFLEPGREHDVMLVPCD
jgi:hypothetical protein